MPLRATEAISLTVASGEFVTIIGPSDCGKSTLFSVLAGLVVSVVGAVAVQGVLAVGVPGLVGYMPQRDALLPWRTVLENVALGPEITGGRGELRAVREDARARLPLFGLADFADAYPAELSGGMRQRAAFLRTVPLPRPRTSRLSRTPMLPRSVPPCSPHLPDEGEGRCERHPGAMLARILET